MLIVLNFVTILFVQFFNNPIFGGVRVNLRFCYEPFGPFLAFRDSKRVKKSPLCSRYSSETLYISPLVCQLSIVNFWTLRLELWWSSASICAKKRAKSPKIPNFLGLVTFEPEGMRRLDQAISPVMVSERHFNRYNQLQWRVFLENLRTDDLGVRVRFWQKFQKCCAASWLHKKLAAPTWS